MSNGFLFLACLLTLIAYFLAASDAYNQNPKYGLILLLCPAIYWTYALAYFRRPRALGSLGVTLLALAAFFMALHLETQAQ